MKNDKSKKQFGYIYLTTCLINNKIYVGQRSHHNPEKDIFYIGSGTAFRNAINKYGKNNFVKKILIIINYNEILLNKLETRFIEKYDATNSLIGYNILPTHAKGFNGANPSHISECVEKTKESMKIFRETKEYKEMLITLSKKRLEFCESKEGLEERERMRILMLEKWEDPIYIKKRNEGYKEYEESEKYKKLMTEHSERLERKWNDVEWRNQQSISRKNAWNDKERKDEHLKRFNKNEIEFRKKQKMALTGSRKITNGIDKKMLKAGSIMPFGYYFSKKSLK